MGRARGPKGMAFSVQNWYRVSFVDYVEHIKNSFSSELICYTYSDNCDKKLVNDQFFNLVLKTRKNRTEKTNDDFCSFVFFKIEVFLFDLWCGRVQTLQ